MSVLILGRKSSGKSTFLHILSRGKANIKHDINIFAVPKEDERLIKLSNVFQSKTITPIHTDFIDFPGEATFSKKDANLRTYIQKSDLIIYIIPAFLEEYNPLEEIKKEESELIIHDLELCERQLKGKTSFSEKNFLERIYNHLSEEKLINSMSLKPEEEKLLISWNFLSLKPIFYAINVSPEYFEDNKNLNSIIDYLQKEEKNYIIFSGILEEEVISIEKDEALEYLSLYGIKNLLSERVYDLMFKHFDLITFFTGNEKEVRAWKLKNGSTAIDAAGTIHSDLAKGFIRAEVIPWDKLVEEGSWKNAHQKGLISVEKKDYVVKDGDVLLIRFHL